MERTILFDETGAVTTDVALARSAEVTVEDAIGREIRHYGTVGPTSPSETGDEDQTDDETADRPKATWDVWVQDDGEYRLASTLAELGSVMEFGLLDERGQREQLAQLMLLPTWDGMPAQLRDEITAFLERTRPA